MERGYVLVVCEYTLCWFVSADG